MITSLFQKWKNDIHALSEEKWEDVIAQYTKLMIYAKDKFVQIKFLYIGCVT